MPVHRERSSSRSEVSTASAQWSRLRAESGVRRQERPQRPAGMEQLERGCLELAVGLKKGLEAWDELLLAVVGEREAVVAEREPGKAALLSHQILTRRRWPDS